ncbi:MAG: hypothetical protein QF819_08095 [Gemmatimonadota bacterium]|jgi:hypothetical protein|nr:hypothetical protein [Gemmatimonadota bacterium]MDP6529576.1 hypothetical protein [Gemmatimonadota bacterium]MDP6803121.1 hypothetical protein [Gemmatimonadota bacterium]MDP7031900.1 hypothetical protein [Gemmatimonadota bacterium]
MNQLSVCLRGAAIAAVVTLLVVPSAEATTALEPLSIGELSGLSDAVVHGTIGAVRCFAERGNIFTELHVTVAGSFKGAPAEAVTLRMLGGQWEGKRTSVIGAPCLSTGDEVVLFLREGPAGTHHVVNLSEGKFEVVRDAGAPRVQRDLEGIAYVRRRPELVIPETLASLESAVRTAVRTEKEVE